MKISLHKLDPRTKLVIVLCLSTLGIAIENVYILLGTLILSVMVSTLLGCKLLSVVKKMKRVLWLFLAIAFIQSVFSRSGTVFLELGDVPLITGGGVLKGIIMAIRISIILTSAIIMTTSNSREIVQGFVQMKIPYEIAFMVSVAIRFLPILTEEIKDTLTAIQLRGVELDKIPVKRRIRVYSYVLLPIVISTIIKSQELSTAMEMRAFRAYPNRTSYRVLKMNSEDYAVITLSIIASGLVFLIYHILFRNGGIL